MILLEKIPFDRISRIKPVLAQKVGRYYETMAQVKARVGCTHIINAGTYDMTTYELDSGLKIDGKVLRPGYLGYGSNDECHLDLSYAGTYAKDYFGFFGDTLRDGKHIGHLNDRNMRGRTGIGVMGDSLVLVSISDNDPYFKCSSADFISWFTGCDHAGNLDGGGSSQWLVPDGKYESGRRVAWYLCLWVDGKENDVETNLPLNGTLRVTAPFGEINTKLWKNGHEGVDLVSANKNVYATCDGTVKVVAYDAKGWGQYISIQPDVRLDPRYDERHITCHLVKGSQKVKPGDRVSRKTIIGTMGATGKVTGPHVHFQINQVINGKGVPIDPTPYLGIQNKRYVFKASECQVDTKTYTVTVDKLTQARAAELQQKLKGLGYDSKITE